ncbi:hypothetical protein [Phaeobacter italicus]|uniref:hypothetical protein n=1 Tax=Phaeobacter italicus TaxID=481446 RepID=UPI001CD7A580|nr:hypothetical protein [Phaeobacter italicus]MCA0855487.1 hypothetical protein [Phaeobacter italicus]
MSEPVTQTEIEDVLSSIRRLVSEDNRADRNPDHGAERRNGTAARVAEATADPRPKAPVTRLVLTPALRVPENRLQAEDTPTPPTTPVATSPLQDTGQAPVQEIPAGDAPVAETVPIAPAAAPVLHDNDPDNEDLAFFQGLQAATPRGDETGPDDEAATDHGIDHSVDTIVFQATPDGDPADEAADEAAEEAAETAQATDIVTDDSLSEATTPKPSPSEDAPWADPNSTLFEAAGVAPSRDSTPKPAGQLNPKIGAVVQKLAEMEAANAARPVLWEPDGSRDTPYAGSDLEPLQWADTDTAEPATDAAADPLAEADETAEPIAMPVAQMDSPTAEAEPRQADPQPEPLVLSEPAQASPVDPATADGASQIAEQAVTDVAMDQLAAEDSILDEESLRELVADIVRAELQGALGERITRNVRKLVRREIQRALSAQDLL